MQYCSLHYHLLYDLIHCALLCSSAFVPLLTLRENLTLEAEAVELAGDVSDEAL